MYIKKISFILAISICSIVCTEKQVIPSLPLPELSPIDHQLYTLITEHQLQSPPLSLAETTEIQEPLAQLGKRLFFSRSLSGNKDVACASCHHPLLGGGDGLSLSIGVGALQPELLGPGREVDLKLTDDVLADGQPAVPRNSQTIFNVAFYNHASFWDGRLHRLSRDSNDPAFFTPDSLHGQADLNAGTDQLAAQARFPVVSELEMLAFSQTFAPLSTQQIREVLAKRIAQKTLSDITWKNAFNAAFPNDANNLDALVTYDNISAALSAYQRSFTFLDSPWADFVQGDTDAISEFAKKGALLFFKPPSEQGFACSRCHSGPFFTDEEFHALAMPQIGRGKNPTNRDDGLRLVTQKDSDRYKFRTPNLLNVEATAPYGHAGGYNTLVDVIKHHLNAQQSLDTYDFSLQSLEQFRGFDVQASRVRKNSLAALAALGEQKYNYNIEDPEIKTQILLLVEFLKTLTDPRIKNAEFLKPWYAFEPSTDLDILAVHIPSKNYTDPRHAASLKNPVQRASSAYKATREAPELALQVPVSEPYQEQCPTQNDKRQKSSVLLFVDIAEELGLVQPVSETVLNFIQQQRFSKPRGESKYFLSGVAVGDVNRDCWLDLFTSSGGFGDNALWVNQQGKTFTDKSNSFQLNIDGIHTGPMFVDLNGDYRDDLLLGNFLYGKPTIYLNSPIGFIPFAHPGFKNVDTTFSSTFADIDADGDLDLFLTHWGAKINDLGQRLFVNRGDLTFIEMDDEASISSAFDLKDFSFSPAFVDLNADHKPDLWIVADFAESLYFINEGGHKFNNQTASSPITDENGMGLALGDFDNDLDIDIFVSSIFSNTPPKANWGISGNRLYRNDGAAIFSDVTPTAGVQDGGWGWGSCAADFNNDGNLDIFQVNGINFPYNDKEGKITDEFISIPARLWLGDGAMHFREEAALWGIDDRGQGRGLVCFDYDRDGDIDIYIAKNMAPPSFYENQIRREASTHFLNIKLVGKRENSAAIGAKIIVTLKSGKQLYREVTLHSNHISHNPTEKHFGLADQTKVDVTIRWPLADDAITQLKDVAANQFLVVLHPALTDTKEQ